LYHRIEGSLVSAGDYRIRGLARQAVTPKYEFAVCSGEQSPPWKVETGHGGWLADHTPPAAALFLPGSNDGKKDTEPCVLLSSPVSEAGDGLVLCDLEGRRVSGTRTVGAGDRWVGAELLARDVGTRLVPNQLAYLAVDWLDKAEVWALGPISYKAGHGPSWGGTKVFTYPFPRREDWAVGGLAVRDGRIVLSLPKLSQVLLIDAAKGTLLGKTEVEQPRGLAFDANGRLLVLAARSLTAWEVVSEGAGFKLKRLEWTAPAKFEDPHLPGAAVDLLEYKLASKIPPTKSFPQTPVWVGERLYLSNCFAGDPTNGETVVSLYHYRDGIAVPVASLGNPADAAWDLLRTEPFRSRWPADIKPPESGRSVKSAHATFVWCDLNDDGQVQPDEVQIVAGAPGSVTLDGELGLTTSTAVRYASVGFTSKGAPRYDLALGTELAEGQRQGNPYPEGQVLAARNGWAVFTIPPKPLPGCYLAGCKDGRLNWTYPEEFLGLGNSHHSKPPRHPGDVIGTTRLLGRSFLAPRPGDRKAEPIELWAINGNYGNIYLFTTDGLLVAALFQDSRSAKPWPNEERRGFEPKEVSLDEECFFPSIQQMADGRVYVVAGKSFSAIFEITGLDTIRRLPERKLTVTADHIAAAQRYLDARLRREVPDRPSKGSK
jgi:hypothetical protein